MYDKAEVSRRFLEEVDRLINEEVKPNAAQVAAGCGLKSYDISAISTRTDVSMRVLVAFVTAYRRFGVSYDYLLEGKRHKPPQPHRAITLIEQAREQLNKSVQLLTA